MAEINPPEMRRLADILDDGNQGENHDATTERVITMLNWAADRIDDCRTEISDLRDEVDQLEQDRGAAWLVVKMLAKSLMEIQP